MIPRYARPEMARVWEERERLQRMLDVEIAVCEELAERGEIPKEAVAEIKAKAAFDPARVREIERVTKHDVIAFLTNVAENVGPASRFIHMGLTSSDALDTALALQLVRAADILLDDIARLRAVLKRRAHEHKRTLIAGRTHGMHAEPTTLGLKIAVWHAEFGRAGERVRRARETVRVGKISGAVGVSPHIAPEVEEAILRRLGLEAEPASGQIVQRDRHAEYHAALALVSASIARVATEVRHLQRTEVGEAEEYFSPGQKGSSAMPHKRNPVVSEQLCGLARVVQGNAMAALQNVPLWHERDISHSSVERVILPDSAILVDYMLAKLEELMDRWVVYPERMKENLERSRGLLLSEHVMLALIRKGLTREEAYARVQGPAMEVWAKGGDFQARLLADPGVGGVLGEAELARCFDLDSHFRHVDGIFRRVFAEED
ncbi:MAG: adenylosuccinate lyase [Candidatus Tectomicrobia bacterium]|uniref:Adenylosuccinate lyase n=1 Tax=Tectimicrobiota bacterium TaxID=2528274 RepID=A0A932I3C1_UNCTE|nr:adenylosuccinate lyase [Candidatus Tectomicrobia bacterium]